MTTTEAPPHVHRWIVEPLDTAVERWHREGVPLDDRALHGECSGCGQARAFSQYVEVADTGHVFKTNRTRPTRDSSSKCTAGLHPVEQVRLASNGRRYCSTCQSEAAHRRWAKRPEAVTASAL